MSNLVILGAQWGDEGKGKITDYLAKKADLVVRYQGGDNAGHTVELGNQKYKLHLVPSGILYNGKSCVIGNGVVVNPTSLVREIKYLNDLGINTDSLMISDRAHIIFPYHIEIDRLEEEMRGEDKIGTTIKGIGPCYRDKVERSGIRMCDYENKEAFETRLRANIRSKNNLIVKYYEGQPLDEELIVHEAMKYMDMISKYITDVNVVMRNAVKEDSKILFEGAQGTLLDIDYGTYPFVTSSHPTTCGIAVGAGISPYRLQKAIGVVKAYTTRVGKGPFVTELHGETGNWIRERGFEYGTTTGRPRRCGWLDMVMLNYSAELNGLSAIALTKLDTLSDLESIKICVAYKLDGEIIDYFPASLETLSRCEPIYIDMPGWHLDDVEKAVTYKDLPENARAYVQKIEELLGLPADIVSVGPKRDQTFMRKDIF
ncbi:MAG: adenylosuccinate synthase [Tissierellales bacterium]|nr:adenylosuccinate synthase [Tissierellales bacterium]MBN2826344.1 adenylosuccinate synthase [Tissierellales bacterium]